MENKKNLFSTADGTIFGAKRTRLIADTTVYTTFTVAEPLLLRPFVFGSCHGRQGFYGIQSMSFTMSLLPSAARAWRSSIYSAACNYTKAVAIHASNRSSLNFILYRLIHQICLRQEMLYRTMSFPCLRLQLQLR